MPKRSRRTQPDREPSPSPARLDARTYWLGLAVIVIASTALRLACANGDLWLDEIRTLRLLEDATTPVEILTKLLHDNNHPINSLYLFLLGPGRTAERYRLLAIVAGAISVLLAGEVGRLQTQLVNPKATTATANIAGLFTAACVGFSYLLVHYTSEARGYGPATCFSLLAIYALSRGPARRSGAPLYWMACVLGLLSHVTVVQVMLGGLAWSTFFAFGQWRTWRDRFTHVAYWHVVPWTVFGLYYSLFISRVAVGGGPIDNLWRVLSDLASFLIGIPVEAGWAALIVLAAVVVAGCAAIWRQNRAVASFFWIAVVIGPLVSVSSEHFILLFPRYFLISGMCALLLAGRTLAQLWTSDRRAIGAVLLALFLIGNGVYTARLIRDGRGRYREALQYVAAHSSAPTITVAADNDFRNRMVIEYYAASVPGKTIEFYPATAPPPTGAEWLFFHRLDNDSPPADRVSDRAGHRYLLEHVFPHAALSGWDWYVFRRVN
jgi:hypothetical protein